MLKLLPIEHLPSFEHLPSSTPDLLDTELDFPSFQFLANEADINMFGALMELWIIYQTNSALIVHM